MESQTTPEPDLAGHAQAPVSLRKLGRLRVLEALADTAELSRPELARITGLSRATVASIVYDLIAENLVGERPAAATTSRLGRPPSAVHLLPTAAYAVGIDIGHDHVRTLLSDLGGASRWDRTIPLDVDDAADGALDAAATAVRQCLGELKLDPSDVLGVGVGIACPVDPRAGVLHAEGIMPAWSDRRPGEELAARTGLPTKVINDANACVLAERQYGAARTWDDVVYLRLSAGVGAGIVCDGRMLLGHDGLAGELGHVAIDPGGQVCRCGSRGCLETVASPTAIAALLSRSWARPVSTTELLELVADGDRGARRAVEDAGDAVGRALAATVMTLNPRLIIIGGDLSAAGAVLTDAISRTLRRNSVASHHEVEVALSGLGDTAAVRGAAALVLAGAPQQLVERIGRGQ